MKLHTNDNQHIKLTTGASVFHGHIFLFINILLQFQELELQFELTVYNIDHLGYFSLFPHLTNLQQTTLTT